MFASASIWWLTKLSPPRIFAASPYIPEIVEITLNVLRAFGAGPVGEKYPSVPNAPAVAGAARPEPQRIPAPEPASPDLAAAPVTSADAWADAAWRLSGLLPARTSPHDREIWRLALPAFGALAAEPLYVLVDTAIVGQLGTRPLAGLADRRASC